ncbi:MAG: DUF1697 domain-containing protein [Solirubrobacteraceae bacterium]
METAVTRYAALLRGINLGAKKRVAMADLRALLTGLGLAEVSTLLQSGNAMFASDEQPQALARMLEQAIDDRFGMPVRCLIRTGPQLRAVLDAHPLADVATDGARMMALFLSDMPSAELLAAHELEAIEPGMIHVGDRVIYHWCPDGIIESFPLSAFVEKKLGVTVTARNWNTVTKLVAKLNA